MRSLPLLLAILLLSFVAVAPAAAQEPRGSLVQIAYEADPGGLTPYTFTSGYPLVTLLYDTLLWRDERGVPRPWLARSVRASADGRRLTVRLASGARWHDGVALTAADVAFTFAYVRRNRHPRFTPQLRELEGVTVTGRHRLVLRLRRPSPGFLDQPLADLPILPRHLWARLPAGAAAPAGLPVGSGPYRLVRAGGGDRGLRFAANGRYFLGRPAVRAIQTRVVAGDRALTRAFRRGDVDVALLRSVVGSQGQLESRRLAVARGPSYLGTVLMFNVRRPPFDDRALRRAVARALELPRIARAAAGAGHPIEPAERGILHPRSRWAPRETLHEPDLAGARAVLSARGGAPLRVLAPRDEDAGRAAGRAVVAALRRAGARATLVERSVRELAAAVGQDRAGEDFELAIWVSPPLASYDPDYLRTMFGRGGSLNYSGYASAAFERLADRVTTARPPPARRAAVAEELRLLARDLPVVPLFFDEPVFVYRRVAWDGWRFIAGGGLLDKRSFMRAPQPPRPVPATVPASDTARIGVLGYVALGLFGLALSIVLVGSVRRRR